VPYLLVASAGAIAQYEAAMTPGQMFEVMLQEISPRRLRGRAGSHFLREPPETLTNLFAKPVFEKRVEKVVRGAG
jgi:hypothetical protein